MEKLYTLEDLKRLWAEWLKNKEENHKKYGE